MDDDPVPRSFKGHKYVRNFITSTLLKAAKAATVQKQYVPESISDDDPKTTKFIEAKSLTASSFEKDYITFSKDNDAFVRFGICQDGKQFLIRFSSLRRNRYPLMIPNRAHTGYAEMMKVR